MIFRNYGWLDHGLILILVYIHTYIKQLGKPRRNVVLCNHSNMMHGIYGVFVAFCAYPWLTQKDHIYIYSPIGLIYNWWVDSILRFDFYPHRMIGGNSMSYTLLIENFRILIWHRCGGGGVPSDVWSLNTLSIFIFINHDIRKLLKSTTFFLLN